MRHTENRFFYANTETECDEKTQRQPNLVAMLVSPMRMSTDFPLRNKHYTRNQPNRNTYLCTSLVRECEVCAVKQKNCETFVRKMQNPPSERAPHPMCGETSFCKLRVGRPFRQWISMSASTCLPSAGTGETGMRVIAELA